MRRGWSPARVRARRVGVCLRHRSRRRRGRCCWPQAWPAVPAMRRSCRSTCRHRSARPSPSNRSTARRPRCSRGSWRRSTTKPRRAGMPPWCRAPSPRPTACAATCPAHGRPPQGHDRLGVGRLRRRPAAGAAHRRRGAGRRPATRDAWDGRRPTQVLRAHREATASSAIAAFLRIRQLRCQRAPELCRAPDLQHLSLPPRGAGAVPSRSATPSLTPAARRKKLRDNKTARIARARGSLLSRRRPRRRTVTAVRTVGGGDGGEEWSDQARRRQLQSPARRGDRRPISQTPLTKAVVRRFADMEIFVEIQENVRGADVFVHPVDLVSGQRPPDGVADHHRRAAPLVGAPDHRGDPLFRLRPAGPQARPAHADLGQAGRQPDHPRRRRPGDDARPARRPDPGLLRHPDRQPVTPRR